MAENRSAARRGNRRSGRLSGVSDSGKKNSSGRRSLVKPRLTVLPNPDDDTPRIMLKRIVQTQPQVSPLALQISKHERTEEVQAEVPSKRVSSMGGMQLPDLLPEDTQVTTFHMAKKRKKFSISEFESAADRRLPQNQARSALDSTALARSLHVSVGSLVPADLAEEQGLQRRPKQRRAIDLEAFEAGVEQNMLNRKAQSHLVDSQLGMHTGDAEIMLSTTRLFVQPQLDEHSHNKLSPLQLLDSKTSPWRNKDSGAAPEELRLGSLVSSVGTSDRQLQWHAEDLSLDPEHSDRVTPKPPPEQREDQDPSQQSNPMEQLSLSEEVVAASPELEITMGGGAENLGRPSPAPSSAKTGMKPLKEDKLEDQAIMVELDGLEEDPAVDEGEDPAVDEGEDPAVDEGEDPAVDEGEEPAVGEGEDPSVDEGEDPAMDEGEDPESEEVSLRTPSFVRAAACQPQQSAPLPARPAAPKLSSPCPAKPSAARSSLQPLQAKLVVKSSGASQRRPREAGIVSSWVKKVFSHYAKMPVTREAFRIVEKCSKRYFKQLSNDLEAYASHAGRRTVEMADLEVLMRRQGLVTDRVPMQVLIEHHLPLEYRKLLIPVAMNGNKVIPSQ
ncbi:centromere protein T [Melanerpes formicivorus]|uniref:centromere protein T n=1 Tax=Melanerpes formicivorus TaxID=211600 RepID=UPI00358E50A6